jgi:hypothetical protein
MLREAQCTCEAVKAAHRVDIHRVDNGFKTMTHYPPDTDAQGAMSGYQEPDEHVFSGPTAQADAFSHASDAMGMADSDGDEGSARSRSRGRRGPDNDQDDKA